MTTLRSVDEVVRAIEAAASADRRTIVAVAGPPGAGKSTLAAQLVSRLDAALLPMDGFHLPQARLVELGRRDRMGAPDTFDVEAFLAILRRIRASGDRASEGSASGNSGDPLLAPGFDREREEPVPDAIDISPEFSTVIVEGNYLLLDSGGWEAAAPLFDLALFVEVARDLRLRRLIERHERFGKSPAEARAWALGPDEANARVIEATAVRADHLVALG